MIIIKVLILFLFCFEKILLGNEFENFFETRPYIILLRYSSSYSSYKLNIEKIIENNKENNKKIGYFIDINKIKELNLNTSKFLDNICSIYTDSVTLSQVYQIKFEIESLNNLLNDMQLFYKKTKKYEYNSLISVERMLYRLEIYLRGLSNRLSNL
ncbi:MAG: hypothetical protein N2446_04115 [Elusimicrobiales bacterium]|nr:hypothetical protein [Elusimicrobiales bacterium]